MKTLSENILFHLPITSSSEEEILEFVEEVLGKRDTKLSIYTPNPEIIVKSVKDKRYQEILQQGSILLPDGSGLIIASWILGKPLLYRITGVDFMLKLAHVTSLRNGEKVVRIGFLGGRKSVALKTAECLQSSFPNLTVSFLGEDWKEGIWIPDELQSKLTEMNFGNLDSLKKTITDTYSGKKTSKEIDILFVAFGAPKQEEWIHENLSRLPITVAMGVGGAFDFLSGEVKRAPFLLRFLGLEWLFRLITQPWRWKRQLALLSFIKLTATTWVEEMKQLLFASKSKS